MTQLIVYENEHGGVNLTIPAPQYLEDHTIEDVLAKDCPAHAIVVERSEVPIADNDFFNAWELVKGKVVVNISKAKEITKDRLREERITLLQTQDVAFQRALESGADTSAIVAEKQRLRDLPTLADACKTLDELRGLKA